MTKEKFLDIIKDLQYMHEYENKMYELNWSYNNKWGCDAEVRFPTLEDTVIQLLIEIFHCTEEDIYYFIYDLDFGKKWKPGMITSKDGKDIDHSSPEKFYDWIVIEKEIK